MKIKLLAIFTISILSLNSQAQTGTPVGSIGDFFVQGVYSTINTISVPDAPQIFTGDYARFYFYDTSTSSYVDSVDDVNETDGWQIQYDMGWLPPSTVVYATYFDNTDTPYDYSNDYTPTIIPTPQWMIDGGTTSNVSISNNHINMTGEIPILQTVGQAIPSNVIGLAGRDFEMPNPKFTFDIDFDMGDGSSVTSQGGADFTLNTLGQDITPWKFPFPTNPFQLGTGTFDLNILIIDSAVKYTPDYKCNFPGLSFPIPGMPIAKVKVDAGVTFNATLKGKLVFGQSGSDFGFVNYNGQKTKVVAKAEGTGFIRAGISVLGGLGEASGTLTAEGRIGAGLEYVQFPSSTITPLFAGDFTVSGKIDLKSFWGFGPEKTFGPMNFYGPKSFGPDNYNNMKTVSQSYDELFGSSSKTYPIDGTFSVPTTFPQPAFGTRGKKLYSVWVENDLNGNGYLLMARLDTCMSNDLLVTSNDFSIANPEVAIMQSGDALITWTQNRYSSSTLPPGSDIDDLRNASDIWCAIYNYSNDAIDTIFRITDDLSSSQSGRAEGEAKTVMGSGINGLITWVVKDPSTETTDIWYSTVTQASSVWTLGTPAKLNDLPGINKQVVVSYTDATNALAVWINDPDGKDSTLDNRIMYSEWNGTSWSSVPYVLASNSGDTTYEELTMDYNDGYCGIAWTSTVLGTNGDFEKRLDIAVWDDIAKDWSGFYYDTDSMFYFQKPRISISNSGLASICYQAIDMFSDTTNIDPGILYLFLKDLNTTNNWVNITGSPFISDTSTYIWELDAGFSNGDSLYMISQEYNSSGPVTSPNNGVLFGDPNLSMVLRGIYVNNNITISDISEPCNVPTGFPKESDPFNFELLQNYPNPFNDFTTIEFRISDPSKVKLEIFDITGRLISRPINQKLSTGIYQTAFEAGNLKSGVYFYKLTINNSSTTRKMIISK